MRKVSEMFRLRIGEGCPTNKLGLGTQLLCDRMAVKF